MLLLTAGINSSTLFCPESPKLSPLRSSSTLSFWQPHYNNGVRKYYRAQPIRAADVSRSSSVSRTKAKSRSVTAIATIKRKQAPSLLERGLQNVDASLDSAGMKVLLQLVSTEIDPETQVGKRSKEAELRGWAEKARFVADKVEYTAEFRVEEDFGLPGAIIVVNEHPIEFYLETIALQTKEGRVYFPCYSWVHSRMDSPERRVFFSNQAYLLMSETPPGLRDLREKEKRMAAGDGRGIRKSHDLIYDYDLYNDLGNPDKHVNLSRPILGGTQAHPYPRRLRTGRPPCKTDHNSESVLARGVNYYVPRDEAFEDLKQESYVLGTFKLFIHELLPEIERRLTKACEFTCFSDFDRLYYEGTVLQELDFLVKTVSFFSNLGLDRAGLPRFLKHVENSVNLQYNVPQLVLKDRFAWLRDDELGRQVLAGVNPMQIELLKTFPPVSSLDPEIYGSQESAIKAEHLSRQLDDLTVKEAMEQKRLFIVDYHDAFMPFINKINGLHDRKMYASRTFFFLNDADTLSPVAIELSLPPSSTDPCGCKRVFTPGQDSTAHWLWKLAKIHAICNNAGYHQLVNHWLRGHASMEPYVIATHRCLSIMHPVSKLLHPHLRYTLEINALARQLLINADGVIENCFTPGPYSMQVSAAAYKSMWRFDMEGLPADLLRRGMAVDDPNSPFGLKLVIEDYPYAADGLLIWSAIKEWVQEYIALYYSDPEILSKDVEIHLWWEEICHRGHGDKKDEPWWPKLDTKEDLVSILCTIIWVASAHHAAVNFGQYMYGGYVPNHPCVTRKLIPEQDVNSKEYQAFLHDPQRWLLNTLPNKYQSTYVMSVLDSLSTHAPDEEYLGQRVQTNWTADSQAKAAAAKFAQRIADIEHIIDARNHDFRLKSRTGAGVLPYELLCPTSGPGVTGRGVPNSVSI